MEADFGEVGWKSLDEGPDGEWLLSDEQVEQIALAVGEQLPTELDVFIGITATEHKYHYRDAEK